jgi:uncharacterized protein
MQHSEKLIHLLYVPTIYCNLGCTYCYLGSQTDEKLLKKDYGRAISTLKIAIDKFSKEGVIPFNISLHGGEVTTLPGQLLSDLFDLIKDHYVRHQNVLSRNNFNKTSPHIKTNLYNFDKHYDLFNAHQVSISASVDLPLSLHAKYRVSKRGESTLRKTLSNIELLTRYSYHKKMSAVLYGEHLDRVDEIIDDIWMLHKVTGFDMNHFNFMFGFESASNQQKFKVDDNLNTKAVSGSRQVDFYRCLKKEFSGTELEWGFRKHWFEEFTPDYCANSFNCGEKFFLLQSDGNMFSCVRGQTSEAFHYGNIYADPIADIMQNAEQKIVSVHRSLGMHDDCKSCEYLSLCNTGCPYVKHEEGQAKSYTCALQKEIYQEYPDLYPAASVESKKEELNNYIVDMHPQLILTDLQANQNDVVLPNDLHHSGNALQQIIEKDSALQQIFSADSVIMTVNGERLSLQSQITKVSRKIITLSDTDRIEIHVTRKFFNAACDDPIRNTLHLQFLRDTTVIYGDEQRTKQEHLYNFEVFSRHLKSNQYFGNEMLSYDVTQLFKLLSVSYLPGVLNNLFVTTHYLRKYHYEKHQANAFYHIQTINLPFQNIEYYWV